MKNQFIILSISIGIIIIVGLGVIFIYPNKIAVAQSVIWDPVRCSLAYAQCAFSAVECERWARMTLRNCGMQYDRAVRACQQIKTRADAGLARCTINKRGAERRNHFEITRCQERFTQCRRNVEIRHRKSPARLELEFQRCENDRLSCISRAGTTREREMERYENCKSRAREGIAMAQARYTDCRISAENRKLNCEAWAASRMVSLIQRCTDRKDRCIARIDQFCR
jgi:hypothetical protein